MTTDTNRTNEELYHELADAQEQLAKALEDLKTNFWSKLKPKERQTIEAEFQQINILIERLKSGMVWIAFFGKTSSGKSSVINSLLGENIARVGVEHGTTTEAIPYQFPEKKWMLVDVPGILDGDIHEKIALEEAEKAHGLVFVIDGQPFHDELELFKRVHSAYPNRPVIVFVNKLDKLQLDSKSNQEKARRLIERDMGQFVTVPENIVYGSAQILNRETDEMERQALPQLMDRMYEDAGELGIVMNLLDPAGRAVDITAAAHQKILEVRKRVARTVISGFALASAAEMMLPYSFLYATPLNLTAMVGVVLRVMNLKGSPEVHKKIAKELWEVMAQEMGLDITVTTIAEAIFDTATLTGIGAIAGIAGNAVLIKTKMWRTAVLGELTLRYVEEGGHWEGKYRHQILLECQDNVRKLYGLRLGRQED